MSKRSSKTKSKRRSRTLPALGFAGVSLSMASGACASVGEATANAPPAPQSHSHEIFLGEEEISDVSLATFYVFDKEITGPSWLAHQLRLTRGCGGGGCHGCGGGGCHMGCGGCRCGGCHVACHGCGHGHFFFRACVGCGGCGGCGGTCWIWTPAWGWVYSCWARSLPEADASPVASEGKIEQTAEAVATVDGSVGAKRTK
jgi:hypothetical protein